MERTLDKTIELLGSLNADALTNSRTVQALVAAKGDAAPTALQQALARHLTLALVTTAAGLCLRAGLDPSQARALLRHGLDPQGDAPVDPATMEQALARRVSLDNVATAVAICSQVGFDIEQVRPMVMIPQVLGEDLPTIPDDISSLPGLGETDQEDPS